MKNVRMQFPQYVSPITSYKDAVDILKGKRIINEAHKLTTAQIIDRLNPYHFRRGVELELSKAKEVNKDTYEKIREKVAKKMQKNPLAYEDQVFANAKEVEKRDEPLHTKEVKGGANVDKKNAMKVKKKNEKANVRASKKENKKGNPRGVKHMTYNAKKAKGVSQTLPATGKEKILDQLKESLLENMGHDWNVGRFVHTPDGEGNITKVSGGTLTVKLKNGEERDYQINVIDKATRDAAFSKLPNLGTVFNKPTKEVEEATVSQYGNISAKEQDSIKKEVPDAQFDHEGDEDSHNTSISSDSKSEPELRAILKKILMMPEMQDYIKSLKEAGDIVTVEDPAGEQKVLGTYGAGKGKTKAAELRSKGFTSAKSISAK